MTRTITRRSHGNTWQLHPMRSAFPLWAETWDRLNTALLGGHPLFDSRFVGALIRHFGRDDDLLAVASEGREPAMPAEPGLPVAMLLLRRKRLGWMTFLPAQTQVAPLLMRTTLDPMALLDLLPGLNLSLDLLCQDPDYSPWLPVRGSYPARCMTHAVTMNLLLTAKFGDFLKSRSKNFRDNVKRRFRQAESKGIAISMRVLVSPEDVSDAIARYGELEIRGWKSRIGTAVHADNAQGHFYREIFEAFARTGQAAVYELHLGERLAASKLTLGNDAMIINLKKTYEEELSEFSPGKLVDYLQVEREFDAQRYRVMEYYTNATADQLSWATSTRSIDHHTFYRYSPLTAIHDRLQRRSDAKA
jgi:hypothetical protein